MKKNSYYENPTLECIQVDAEAGFTETYGNGDYIEM